jgi:hypothetical protein
MDCTEIITKLIGPITPVGATHIDEGRFENLKKLCELTQSLVILIDEVAVDHKTTAEYSRSRAGKFAADFLRDDLGISA